MRSLSIPRFRAYLGASKRWFGCGWEPPVCPLPCPCALLLDHLIRQDEERRGERDPEGVGRLQVEDQLELGGLLHRQVRRFGTLEDFVHVVSDVPPRIYSVHIVGHQPSRPCTLRSAEH